MKTWDEMTPLEVFEATQEFNRLNPCLAPWFLPNEEDNPSPGDWSTPFIPWDWLRAAEGPRNEGVITLPTRNEGR